MAWVESHQELRDHPKVIRLARLLDIQRTSAIGVLHLLWWWALDHADSGDLGDYDAIDIADACLWEGDPDLLFKALSECGPGDRAGFLEVGDEGRWVLHDWWQYAGKLVARRQADRARKAAERAASSAGSKPQPAETPASNGRPQEVSQSPCATGPNRTVPNQPLTRPDVDRLCDLMAELVESNGCRRPPVTKEWRTEARLLLDKDNVPIALAESVMRWALADPFWRSNVLSLPKFRKQFDQLRMKAHAPQPARRETPHSRSQQAVTNVARAMGVDR